MVDNRSRNLPVRPDSFQVVIVPILLLAVIIMTYNFIVEHEAHKQK